MESIKNSLVDFFKDLKFYEEEHIYTVEDRRLPSVSSKIKKFGNPFKADLIAERKAKREGTNAEDLKQQWSNAAKDACDLGHKVHLFGELYPFNNRLQPSDGFEEAIVKFWSDLPDHISIVCTELRMYHKKKRYAGTADIILYDNINHEIIIADYKTNKDLFKNFAGQKLKGPFINLLDNPFNKYQIQLSLYQILLEQTGFKVGSRKIIWLRSDGTYQMYDTNNFTKLLC